MCHRPPSSRAREWSIREGRLAHAPCRLQRHPLQRRAPQCLTAVAREECLDEPLHERRQDLPPISAVRSQHGPPPSLRRRLNAHHSPVGCRLKRRRGTHKLRRPCAPRALGQKRAVGINVPFLRVQRQRHSTSSRGGRRAETLGRRPMQSQASRNWGRGRRSLPPPSSLFSAPRVSSVGPTRSARRKVFYFFIWLDFSVFMTYRNKMLKIPCKKNDVDKNGAGKTNFAI